MTNPNHGYYKMTPQFIKDKKCGCTMRRRREKRIQRRRCSAMVFHALLVFVSKIRQTESLSPWLQRSSVRSRHASKMVTNQRQQKSDGTSPSAREPIKYGKWTRYNDTQAEQNPPGRRPIPSMPSQLFVSLAQSQLEVVANSVTIIKSMALYLPQENVKTGQLEFLPAVLYPLPSSERVFIAPGADSGIAPSLPKTLTALPGFAHAQSLLPGYPMVSSSGDPGVGEAEEVMCDPRTKDGMAALSIPLFFGSQTVGVLLVWPSTHLKVASWTKKDKEQIRRAAQSLSLALSMDADRSALQMETDRFREALSDSLHQVRNPLQALRTYGKLLQQRIANTGESSQKAQLLTLAQHLIVQSDRVVDLLLPMDSLAARPLNLLNPSSQPEHTALIRWEDSTRAPSWTNQTESFSLSNQMSNSTDVFSSNKQPSRHWYTQPVSTSSSVSSSSPAGDDEIEMSFIMDVLEPILSGFEAIASEGGITFHVRHVDDELPGVMASPKSLQEVVSNVIDNAFKYVVLPKPDSGFTRNPSPRVCVRLMANRKPLAPGVTILVEDNGPGIPETDRFSIFKRGFRSETTSSVEGSGIGLDISKTLITRMGGMIEVATNSDKHASLDGAALKIILFRNPNLQGLNV